MQLTQRQWFILVRLILLQLVTYAVIYLTAGSLATLHWVLWGILSAPYAQGALLGFLLVAGRWSIAWRRLSAVAGIVAIMAICLLFFDREVVLIGVTASASALVAAIVSMIASRYLTTLPKPNLRNIHFALWEVIAMTCLIGLLLMVLRVVEFDTSPPWPDLIDPYFTTYAITSALFLVICALAALTTNWKERAKWFVGCLALWIAIPWIDIGLFSLLQLDELLELSGYLLLFYPAHAIQAVIVWGTLFPLRYGFPGSLSADASSIQPKAEQSNLTDDFAEMN